MRVTGGGPGRAERAPFARRRRENFWDLDNHFVFLHVFFSVEGLMEGLWEHRPTATLNRAPLHSLQ